MKQKKRKFPHAEKSKSLKILSPSSDECEYNADDDFIDNEDENEGGYREESAEEGSICKAYQLLNRFEIIEKDGLYQDEVLKLSKAVKAWIEKKISNKYVNLTEVTEILRALHRSSIPRSKLILLKMILNDISDN